MVQHDYIRFAYFNQNKSIRAIAKEMGIHRNTVKRAIENPEQKYNLTVERDKPVNGAFEERIKQMIQTNSQQSRRERLTKIRMYDLICEEGYEGSYSAFTYLTRQIEDELDLKSEEGFLKLVPLKGSMQVDFGEVWVLKGGKAKKLYVFCAKLCYSKVEFVKILPLQKTEFLFDGLVSAFKFFGGVPKKIIFDNLKPAVKKVLHGTDRELQDEFLKFKSFYCFDAIFCGPAKGNEKGMVENLVKYVKNNYFLPRPEFIDFDSFNAELTKKCTQRLEKGVCEGESWTKRLLEEDFLPLNDVYEYARIKEAKVDTYQLVHVERNRYSVPTKYIGKRVQARIYPFKIVVSYKDETIAEHDRLFGRNYEHLDPYHYLRLLQKKARAYDQAKVIHDWKLPAIYETYHKQLQAHRKSNSEGTREFIDILKLTESHQVQTLGKILKELSEKNRYSYQDVLSLLRYQAQCNTNSTKPLANDTLKNFNLDTIRTTYLPPTTYNDLLMDGGV